MRSSDWSSDVAGLDIQRGHLAVFGLGAGADGDDFAFLRLFLGGVGDDDAAGGLLFRLYAANENAVMQRTKCHVECLSLFTTLNGMGMESRRASGDRKRVV